MGLSRFPAVAAFVAALLAQGAVQAQSAASTFAIRGYQIVGSTLLPQDLISVTVMPFTGPKSSFETIQLALEALEKAYVAAGYGAVKVEVPEQDIQDGVVKLVVVEARLDRVEVTGQKFHDQDNILGALPALQSGQPVNLNQLQRNLALANENSSKHTSVTFRQSEANAQTDALVRVADEDPVRMGLSLDNTGNEATGRFRMGFSFYHSNLFNRDHVLSAQVLSSPTKFDQVGIVGLGYRIPLYQWGDALDFTIGYSNADSGQIDLFTVSGSGVILGARYEQNLLPAGEWQHKLTYSLDRRQYDNRVVPIAGGASQIPNLQVHPIGLSYGGHLRSAQRDLAAALTLSHNLPTGTNGSTAAFNQPGGRIGANAAFTTLKLSSGITERVSPDWSLRAAVSGQYTNDLLISPEQFGAGGADSVRGFEEREIAADRGVRTSFEVWGPDVGPRFGLNGLRMQPITFVDAAWVRFSEAPGSILSQSISSVGLGLRAWYERRSSFRLDYAYVTDGAQNTAGSTTATAKGSWRLHGSLFWLF